MAEDSKFDLQEQLQNQLPNEDARTPEGEGVVRPMSVSVGTEPDPESAGSGKSYLEAPYAYSMAQNESVVLNSGALHHTVTDFVLPGRNGFDLAVTRRYNSEQANLIEINPTHDGYGKFGTASRNNTHHQKAYGLGFGWQLVLPSIETVPEAERSVYITYSSYLHLEDGRSFAIEGNTLKDHPLSDVTIAQAAGSVAHPQRAGLSKSYDVTVSYKNGCRDHFAKVMVSGKLDSYKLVARLDRFGNAIFYSMTDYGGMIVTDSWGRDITLAKAGDILTWSLPDGGTVVYTLDQTGGRKLASVTDPLGRITRYTYYNSGTYQGMCKFASVENGDTSAITFNYMLLESVWHPTGAQTRYDYGLQDGTPAPLQVKTKPYDGFKQYYPVRRRRDFIGAQEYNTGSYTYTLAANGEYIQTANVQLPFGVAEQHTFNDKNQLTQKQVRHGGALVLQGAYTYGATATAENYKLITQDVTKRFNPQNEALFTTRTTQWTYTADKKGNVAKITESCPDDPALDQQTDMAYGTYSILTEKKLKKDGSTVIKEAYALNAAPNDKAAAFRRVYENDVLREKTQYLYDNAWCLTERRRFYAAAGAALESSADYHAVTHAYNTAKYTHAPVSTTVCGLRDAEGIALPDAVESFDYDVCGRLLASTNALGHTTRFSYDALGRVVREETPEVDGVAHHKTVAYNDAANTITQTDENGNKQRTEYTALGRPARVLLAVADTPAAGDVLLQSIEYDALERPVCEKTWDGTGGLRAQTNTTYDAFGRVLAKAVPQGGYNETHEYQDVCLDGGKKVFRHQKTVQGGEGCPDIIAGADADLAGRTVKETAAGGVLRTMAYDKLGNKLAQTDALGNTTRWEYDWAGRQTATLRTVDGAQQRSTAVYDALGNKTASTDFLGNRITYAYDALGRLLAQRAPFDDENTAETRHGYDAAGNLVLQRVWQGETWRETAYRYNARGRQIVALLYLDDGRTQYLRTEYTYDGVGNKLRTVTGLTQNPEENGSIVEYSYDRFGNVLGITDDAARAENTAERYEYDATGRLLCKTDRCGGTVRYSYDAMGRVIQEEATATTGREECPVHITTVRATSYAPGGQKLRESVSESREDLPARVLESVFAYDGYGRLITQTDPDGVRKTFSYDAAGNRRSFMLEKDDAAEIVLWYTYDEANRLRAVRQNDLEGTPLAEYEYDANGSRTRLLHPQNGGQTRYAYNKAERVTSLANTRGSARLCCFEYAYSPDGNQTRKTQGGVQTLYTYDRLGRLVREEESEAGRVLGTLNYEYDRFGNRVELRAVYPAGSFEKSHTTVYEYGPSNRLMKEVKSEGETTETYTYWYDANGSQTRRELQRTYPAGKGPRGRIGFVTCYNKRGQVTLDTRQYNGFGQLVRVNRDCCVTDYQYRPDGLRHGKSVRGSDEAQSKRTVHYWDGQNMVMEVNGNTGAVKARYLRGANLIAQEIGENTFYYLFNAHGDVVQRLGAGENHAPVYKYDAFGNERKPVETDPNPFRYCGEYFDLSSGEYYLRNRTYDPRTGRFSREDPARSGNNWYGYCRGNPIEFVDSSGLAPKVAGISLDGGGPVIKATPQYELYNQYLANKTKAKKDTSTSKTTSSTKVNIPQSLTTSPPSPGVSTTYPTRVAPFESNHNVYFEDTGVNSHTVTVEFNMYQQSYGVSYVYQYQIQEGIIKFFFDKNPGIGNLQDLGIDDLFYQIMLDSSEEAGNRDNATYMTGRTLEGIRGELEAHDFSYRMGLGGESANPADIGAMGELVAGWDWNAHLFEMYAQEFKLDYLIDFSNDNWKYAWAYFLG